MKKLILLVFVSTMQIAFGQLTNLNLESWTTTPNGPEPSQWTYVDGTGATVYGTYNIYTQLTTSKITGAQAAGGSGSSAKLQTILDVPGMLYQAKPFSGVMPQAVSFSLKNQTVLNDTSFVQVTIYDASGVALKQAYLELYNSDNNINWHLVGIPFVTLTTGTPASIDFWAQSSFSDFPTVSGSTLYIDNISLNPCTTPIVSSFTETSCQPYVWNGQTYSTSGSYSQTFVSQNGCDSTVTLNLSVINPGPLTAVPDPVFEQKLIDLGYDPCGLVNGFVPTSYIDTVTSLIINGTGINNLTGIEGFTSLEYLSINPNSANLSSSGINLSLNLELKHLDIKANLTSLNLTENINLEYLDISNNNSLSNQIVNLDLSANINLQFLDCSYSGLSSLNLPSANNLTTIYCDHNGLNSINLSNVSSLINLDASYNALISLGTNSNNSIQSLNLKQNYFSGLDLSNFSQLKNIDCSNNVLECLNLKNGNNNQFTEVDTKNNFNLTCIQVDDSTYSTNNPTWNGGIDSWSNFSNQCFVVCFTADIDKLEATSFEIFPNPSANNEISIKSEDSVFGKTYRVMDIKGSILFQGKIDQTLQKVDLMVLTSGIYLFQIEGINTVQRLIIE